MNYKDKYVGITLNGYCGGFFGNCYDKKIVIASGENWLVVKDEEGIPNFDWFDNVDDMEEYVLEWSRQEA